MVIIRSGCWTNHLRLEHLNLHVDLGKFDCSCYILLDRFRYIFDIHRNMVFVVSDYSDCRNGGRLLFKLRCKKNGKRWFV